VLPCLSPASLPGELLHVQHVHVVGRNHGHLDGPVIRPILDQLTTIIERRGKPGMIVSDNGITSHAIFAWEQLIALITPATPESAKVVLALTYPQQRPVAGSVHPAAGYFTNNVVSVSATAPLRTSEAAIRSRR
jgi:hypothetical protein